MINDAHLTNFAENKEFFLNQNNPTNFENTWKNISFIYRELGLINAPVQFDEVMDFSVIKKLDAEGKFKNSTDEYKTTFTPTSYSKISAESPILTQVIRVNFYPNSANLYEPKHNDLGESISGTLYDPNVKNTIDKVARLAGQFDSAIIAIAGHTDSSRKGQVPYEAVKELSLERAKAVRDALIKKYKFNPNKFVIVGKAWDSPFDTSDPLNQALNRRVEISVYQPESK